MPSASGSSSYMDVELPDAEDSFVFGDNNTDLAQQLYYRWRADDSAKNVTLTVVPPALQARLDDLKLEWKNLDGIAQRALLWDSGFRGHFNFAQCNWSTGGLFNAIPLPRIVKHDWTDSFKIFEVISIHTLASSEEPAYSECPTKAENGGYSSLVIPCGTTAAGVGGLTTAKGSAWVSRWLVENYSKPVASESSSLTGEQITAIVANGTGQLGTPAIIGIIAGSLVAALVVLGFIFTQKRRSKSSQGQSGLWDDDVITANRIPREKVRVGQLLSRGAFGEVYTGVYNGEHVAVKMLLPSTRRDIKLVNEFLAEAKLTATMEHPRIVSCVGVAWDSLSDLCVVLEFMEGGDLRTLLNNYEKSGYPVGFNREKTTIALHVAHALTYLHSLEPPVIHRDLKSRNIC